MEKISQKISFLEKTLIEMQRDLTNIKNSTYNTNATNSLNASNNFTNINNKSIKTNRESFHKPKNLFKLSKNYFQLTEKEKYFPKEKKLKKNIHSFNLNKKGLNIYNNIFVNSDNSIINNNDEYETIKQTVYNKIIDNNNIKKNSKNKSNDKNQKSCYNNKINNNKKLNNILKSNITSLGNLKLFNKSNSKKTIKTCKNSSSSLFQIKKGGDINQRYFDFEKMNLNNKVNNEDIHYKNKNLYNNINYFPQEEYKYNYSINANTNQTSLEESNDIKINEYLTLNQRNKTQKKNSHFHKNFFQKENNIKIYSQILNILGDESINDLISKSSSFDKYGTQGFNKFIINNEFNRLKTNLDDTAKYLNEYKKYLISLDKENEIDEQIKLNKSICNKLIKMTNVNDYEQLIEDINYKLKKNSKNKNILEKAKNILNVY